MTPETASLVQSVVGALSIIVAFVALVVAIRAESRTEKQFHEQLELQKAIAIASIKPLVTVKQAKYVNRQSITLHNHGLGTAVIDHVDFEKNNRRAKLNIVEFFSFDRRFAWNTFRTFRGGRFYLRAGDSVTIIEITSSNLEHQGFDQKEARRILGSFQTQAEGIVIMVEYEDLLGNVQPTYKKTLNK